MPKVLRSTSSSRCVRAITSILSESGTAVIQILRPLRRQPSPSRDANVVIDVVFIPASGSVSALQNRLCPVTNLGSSRSEEHPSELQSLMRHSYAGFCSKKQKENVN